MVAFHEVAHIALHGSNWPFFEKTRPRGLMLTCERIHLLFDLI